MFELRGESKAAAISKMERFVIIVNGWKHPRWSIQQLETSKMEPFVIIVDGWKPLFNITKRSILDVAAVLDPPWTHIHLSFHSLYPSFHQYISIFQISINTKQVNFDGIDKHFQDISLEYKGKVLLLEVVLDVLNVLSNSK